jgi:hypothetical protein
MRDALPAGRRVRRRLESLLQRLVPQLDRTTRVDLPQHVQSNLAWNFGFVALMTPIFGLGLALVQGNTTLA